MGLLVGCDMGRWGDGSHLINGVIRTGSTMSAETAFCQAAGANMHRRCWAEDGPKMGM